MVRKNSTVWRFFLQGVIGGGGALYHDFGSVDFKGLLGLWGGKQCACNPQGGPHVLGAISLKLSIFPSSNTIWTPLKDVPSLRSIKPNVLESRIDRAQPQTVTVFPA